MLNHHPIMKKIFALLFFALLTACAGQRPPLPMIPTFGNAQTSDVEGRTPISATSTPSTTITPTIMASSTPVFTTRRPTSTPTITTPTGTLSPTRIARLTAQSAVTATYGFFAIQEALKRQADNDAQQVRRTQESNFPINCKESVDFFYAESLSPDGNWLAYTCGDHTIDRTLNIVSLKGKQWTLAYNDFLPKNQLEDTKPSSGLGPVHWKNGDYLYFTPGYGGDYWGTCLYFAGNTALYRLDLKEGIVSAVLPPISRYTFYDFAFSPTDLKLAYIQDGENYPVILDLSTGKKTRIVVEQSSVGQLIWSPDGKQLAYATCQPNPDPSTQDAPDVAYSSIRIYSLETHVSRIILEAENYFYDRIVARNGDPYLAIFDFRYHSYFYYVWSSETLITPLDYPMMPPTPKP
jgi:Tol biopolymer transport system component